MNRRGNCLEHAALLWQLHNGGFFLFRASRAPRLLVPHVLYTADIGRPDATGRRCVGLWRRNGGYLAWGHWPGDRCRCRLYWRLTLRGVRVHHLVPTQYDYDRLCPPVIFDGHELDSDG